MSVPERISSIDLISAINIIRTQSIFEIQQEHHRKGEEVDLTQSLNGNQFYSRKNLLKVILLSVHSHDIMFTRPFGKYWDTIVSLSAKQAAAHKTVCEFCEIKLLPLMAAINDRNSLN